MADYYLSNKRFIDSKYRRSTSNSTTDFTIDIPLVSDATAFKISKLSFFNNQYNIDSRNNKMYYTDSDPAAQTITISSGRYTGTTLATEIQTQMNSASNPAMTCTYSTLTNKFTITDGTGNFQLTTTTTTSAIWDYIGFDTSANKTGASTYTSDNQANLNTKYWYVTLDIADNPQLSTHLPNNIAFIIINNEAWGTLIQIDGQDPIIKTNRRSFNYISAQVYDDKGNLIDTGGVDWSFELQFFSNSKYLLLN